MSKTRKKAHYWRSFSQKSDFIKNNWYLNKIQKFTCREAFRAIGSLSSDDWNWLKWLKKGRKKIFQHNFSNALCWVCLSTSWVEAYQKTSKSWEKESGQADWLDCLAVSSHSRGTWQLSAVLRRTQLWLQLEETAGRPPPQSVLPAPHG